MGTVGIKMGFSLKMSIQIRVSAKAFSQFRWHILNYILNNFTAFFIFYCFVHMGSMMEVHHENKVNNFLAKIFAFVSTINNSRGVIFFSLCHIHSCFLLGMGLLHHLEGKWFKSVLLLFV